MLYLALCHSIFSEMASTMSQRFRQAIFATMTRKQRQFQACRQLDQLLSWERQGLLSNLIRIAI